MFIIIKQVIKFISSAIKTKLTTLDFNLKCLCFVFFKVIIFTTLHNYDTWFYLDFITEYEFRNSTIQLSDVHELFLVNNLQSNWIESISSNQFSKELEQNWKICNSSSTQKKIVIKLTNCEVMKDMKWKKDFVHRILNSRNLIQGITSREVFIIRSFLNLIKRTLEPRTEIHDQALNPTCHSWHS